MTHNNTGRWCDVLQSMVKSYNGTIHRTIRAKPESIRPGLTEELAWRNQYERADKPPKEQGTFRFDVGDMVRLSHLAKVFRREYGQRWSQEVFRIAEKRRRGPFNIYIVEDLQKEQVLGSWYEKELQAVSVDLTGTFVVDRVIRSRTVRGQKQHLVSWKGYPAKFNSYISAEDFVSL